jgi:hypothetical protein
MTERLRFATELSRPAPTLVVVVLISGVPVVLTPEGVRPTSVAWTGGWGAADPLWWPGRTSGDLDVTMPDASVLSVVRDILDPRDVMRVSAKARPIDGDVDVGAVSFDLSDPDGETTALLCARNAHARTLLTTELSDSATDVFVESYEGFEVAGGVATVGRETVIYSGRASSGSPHLTGCTRGAFGSIARIHQVPTEHPPTVAAGVTSWYGRAASVWLARLSDDGLTLHSPTLVHYGVVGNGMELVANGTRFHLTIDAMTVMAQAKLPAPTFQLYGWAHRGASGAPFGQPLDSTFFADVFLTGEASAPHGGGWHPTRESFLLAWNQQSVALSAGIVAAISDDRLTLTVTAGGSDARFTVEASWHDAPRSETNVPASTTYRWRSARSMPSVCVWFDGTVKLAAPGEFASIPTTLTASDSSTGATAHWILTAKTDARERVRAFIGDRDPGASTVSLTPLDVAIELPSERLAQLLITRRTIASLGLSVGADVWWGAVRLALRAVAGQYGADHLEDSVDWAHVASQVRRFASPLPVAREYVFEFEDTLLATFVNEARLNGFCLGVRGGRMTVIRLAGFAPTEDVVATITNDDVLRGEFPVTKECMDGLMMGLELERASKDQTPIRIFDTTSQAEFGDGKVVKVKDPGFAAVGVSDDALASGLLALVQLLTGPYAVPYTTVRLALSAAFYDLEPGDLVALTHPMIPSQDGTRGVTDLVCQVQDVDRQVAGGRARVDVTLRMPEADLAGWAPEALIAAGGLSHASATITLDDSSAWGAACFAPEESVTGAAVTDAGASWFQVGDHVLLSEIDTLSPLTDEAFTVVSVNAAAKQVTLSAVPSVAMAIAAALQYKVVLRFDVYANATNTGQHLFAFIADATSRTLGSGDAADRWAA